MEAQFWHDMWNRNRIGFHEGEANALMTRHIGGLDLPAGGRVFLPLCGKTRDIGWLLARGYRVAGAELSQKAVEQLFEELGVVPEVIREGALLRYRANAIDVFVGDILDVTQKALGAVDAIYDRAALVALPPEMRDLYAAHLQGITGTARQLLICFVYDQGAMDGPPFSIGAAEVARLYGAAYQLIEQETVAVPDRLRGRVAARETAWILRPAGG